MTLPSSSGTVGLSGTTPSFASTPFPYTFTHAGTPLIPGAPTSSASFLCASATGSNFVISNGGPFTFAAIPTLDREGILLLTGLLGASAIVLLRMGRWQIQVRSSRCATRQQSCLRLEAGAGVSSTLTDAGW